VADEDHSTFLRCKDTPGNCYVVLQRFRGILDHADGVTISLQDLVNRLPVAAVYPGTVD
jgi:hypothetical protein